MTLSAVNTVTPRHVFPSNYQMRCTGLLNSSTAFNDQGVYCRLLKGQSNVIAVDVGHWAVLLYGIEHKSFKAAEAEIEPWSVGHGSGKAKSGRHTELFVSSLSPLRSFRHGRASWVVEVQQLSGFVEGLAGGIVY